MKNKNAPETQKEFLFLFSEPAKLANHDSQNDGELKQLEDLNQDDQQRLERELLASLERQGF